MVNRSREACRAVRLLTRSLVRAQAAYRLKAHRHLESHPSELPLHKRELTPMPLARHTRRLNGLLLRGCNLGRLGNLRLARGLCRLQRRRLKFGRMPRPCCLSGLHSKLFGRHHRQ